MPLPDLEIDLLRAFVAVSESGGFSAAASTLGRSQSAVSQKILKIEQKLGTRLFDRTSRSLALTIQGEQLLAPARRILELNDAVVRGFISPSAVSSLRLGIAEDFVPRQLPALLARFLKLYPRIQLELMTGLSCDLLDAYDAEAIDLVIAKKDGAAQRGRVIWREPVVWLAAEDFELDPNEPVPLVLIKLPCSYRDRMIQTLDSVRREWFAACTATSMAGLQAAVAGGLGVSVLGHSFVQSGLRVIAPPEHWPALPMSEVVVLGEERTQAEVVEPLLSFLMHELDNNPANRS